MPGLVAQNEAHVVRSVLHVAGRKKACLPDIFVGEMAQLLHQSERKQRDHGDDGFIRLDAQHRIARTNHPGAQQGARNSEKRCVRGDKFILPSEANNFINGRLIFTFALNFFQ